MRWIAILVLLLIQGSLVGCGGGLSQDDLRRGGIRRPKDPDEDLSDAELAAKQGVTKKKPAVKSNSGKEPDEGPPKPAKKVPAKTVSSKATASPEAAASETAVSEAAAPKAPVESEDENEAPRPRRTRSVSREAEEAKEEEEAARLAAERKERQKVRENPEQANRPELTADDPRSALKYVDALFARLTNPEVLTSAELASIARELALNGTNKEALAYHAAWALTTDDDSAWAKEVRWVPALRRPAMNLHWGLGVEYSGPAGLINKLEPIGKQSKASRARGGHLKPSSNLQTYVGELADRMLLGLDERLERGALGPLFQPPAEKTKRSSSVQIKWQSSITGFNPEPLGPGVTVLGGGTRKELLRIAEIQGVDVLVFYQIVARNNRNESVLTNTTVSLVDVARNQDLLSSATLSNIKVAYARQDRSATDPVEEEFTKLFTLVDEQFAFSAFPPALTSQHAEQRVLDLAAEKHENPLPVLVEMRLYWAKRLINEGELLTGYEGVLGADKAKQLLRGSTAERINVLLPFLPRIETGKK